MKNNIGSVDKIVRVVLALIFSALFFTRTVTGGFGFILLTVGGLLLATVVLGVCPLYRLLGITSCPVKK